jgi:osmotically-inducible protein OsmY
MKSDVDLQADIYEELKWDNRINEADIGVSVQDGIATLSGTIATLAEKWAADESTKDVAGVRAVVNNMEVKLYPSSVKDDHEIAEAALSALTWNVWVPSDSIKVMVERGWVTLNGRTETEHQKRQAEKAIRYLTGVRGVSNELNVEPSASARDIEVQIKRAFRRHGNEDSSKIEIEVVDGRVTLTGSVHSLSEKKQAEWAAFRTDGVRSVKNSVSIS